MSAPLIGQRYRGVEGHSGYLLRQASYEFRGAMELALAAQGLTAAQYTAMSVLARDPGLSGADLARACNTTPQAANGGRGDSGWGAASPGGNELFARMERLLVDTY